MTDLLLIGQRAKAASRRLAGLSSDEKNEVLLKAADALVTDGNIQKILEANAKDLDNAEKSGMSDGLKDRLRLTEELMH